MKTNFSPVNPDYFNIKGKPGPAYDEYDAFALACLDCNVQSD